ncbi:Unknown protein, partial [Striga hermonthica]
VEEDVPDVWMIDDESLRTRIVSKRRGMMRKWVPSLDDKKIQETRRPDEAGKRAKTTHAWPKRRVRARMRSARARKEQQGSTGDREGEGDRLMGEWRASAHDARGWTERDDVCGYTETSEQDTSIDLDALVLGGTSTGARLEYEERASSDDAREYMPGKVSGAHGHTVGGWDARVLASWGEARDKRTSMGDARGSRGLVDIGLSGAGAHAQEASDKDRAGTMAREKYCYGWASTSEERASFHDAREWSGDRAKDARAIGAWDAGYARGTRAHGQQPHQFDLYDRISRLSTHGLNKRSFLFHSKTPPSVDRSPVRQPRPGVTPPNANASQSTSATRPPTELPRTSSCSVHPRASWADARHSPMSRSPSPSSPAIATFGSGHGSQPSNLAHLSAGIHHPLSTHRNPRLLASFLRARLFFVQGLHQQHDSLRRREEYEREDDFDRRSQASNHYDRPKPEKPKVVLSTFTGVDPDAWLNWAAQYFELNEIEENDRVKYAAYYLDGEANVWWQWLTSVYRGRRQVIRWNNFVRELLTRFGTSDYHNYNEALSRIRQTGSLRDYLKEFERLAFRVRGWPETALVGAFIGGLKFDLAAEVQLERPESMHAAMEVARRRDDHLTATRRGRTDVRYLEIRRVQPDASDM